MDVNGTVKATDAVINNTLQAGDIKWGSNSSLLRNDQGGSIELGGNDNTKGTGTPYIDFHYKDLQQDRNARIINDADGKLSIEANTVYCSGKVNAAGSLTVSGPILAEGGLTVRGPMLMDGFLGTDGSPDKVLAKAEEIVSKGPVGSLVIFFGGNGNDLCYAWKSKDKDKDDITDKIERVFILIKRS